MRLYLAGPMSGIPESNFPAFHAAAATLRATGLEIVNPAEINVSPEAGWLACMRADIKELVDCDGIALMDGWSNSRGASLERTIAAGLGLAVHTVADLLREKPSPTGPSPLAGTVYTEGPKKPATCGTCGRDPGRMNSAVAECSHVECPHRGRAWSDRPTAAQLFKGPWRKNVDADPVPADKAMS